MERRFSVEWRLAALAVAAVFLLTSCPGPMVGARRTSAPIAPVTERGQIKCCYIDHDGEFTDDVDGSYGKLYWVERDGRTQPGLVSVGRKDNMINVVNFVDTASGNRFRLFFMDRTNLPYRMVVECKDDAGTWRTLVGDELRYNPDAQELSLRFTDSDDSSQSAVLSGIKLNSELFTLKQGIFTEGDPARIYLGLSYDQYLVTISACLLYAIGQSDMNWSEGSADFAQSQGAGRWGWKGFARGLSAVFACEAVVSFVVATVLAPAVVVVGRTVMEAVISANSVWAGVAVASAALAVASAVGAEYIDEPKTYTATKADSMVSLVNGVEGLTTRLENKNHVMTEEAKYKNIFKVNICTDEVHCPDRS